MRLNAYEAFLTSIRCIGIGAATFRPTGPRPKKHGGVIGQKGGHVTVTSPVQMKIHWKSWHITEIGMTPPCAWVGVRSRGIDSWRSVWDVRVFRGSRWVWFVINMKKKWPYIGQGLYSHSQPSNYNICPLPPMQMTSTIDPAWITASDAVN